MNILVLANYVAPEQGIASIRWTKLIKYLKRNHPVDQIHVLTRHESDLSGHQDSTLVKDTEWFDQMYSVKDPGWVCLSKKVWMQFRKYWKPESGSFVDNTLKVPVRRQGERDFFRRLKKKTSQLDLKQYNVVISSYGPLWPVELGHHLKQNHPSLFWIVDFRDQWVRDFDSDTEKSWKKDWALSVTRGADMFFRVNDHLDLVETWDKPVVTIPNGFDPEDKQTAVGADTFIISYTGTVYKTDDLDPFFQALKELTAGGDMALEDISIVYAGRTPELFAASVRKFGLKDRYADLGWIDRAQSLQLQARSSLLLMAGWCTETDVVEWSGKMYEYMMAEKPVVYLMAGTVPGSLPAQDIQKVGGICYESCRHEDTYASMSDYILMQYCLWKQDGEVHVCQDKEYVNQYSYETIASQVYDILCEGLHQSAEQEGIQ